MKIKKASKIIYNYLYSKENIIKGICPIDFYNDYPKFFQYGTIYNTFNDIEPDNKLIANAISENQKEAIIKAIMETIERYYLTIPPKDSKIIFNSFKNLIKEYNNVVNPIVFFNFEKNQKEKKFNWNEKTKFHWVKAKNFLDDKEYFLPAQLFYLNFPKEKIIRFSDTQGAAADFSIKEALCSSILELIERDAFAIFFYTKKKQKKIDLKKITNLKIKFLIEKIKKYNLEIFSFEITTSEYNIPTITSFIIDKTGFQPALTCGVGCDFNILNALKKSIMEAVQTLNSLRDISYLKNNHIKKDLTKNSPITKRMFFWAKTENLRYFEFLVKNINKSPISIKNHQKKNINQKLKALKGLIKKTKAIIFWRKVTPKILDKYSIFSVKSVSSSLVPLSLFHSYPYLNHYRLKKYKLKNRNIIKLPHPLP